MKKFLIAASALVAMASVAQADGGGSWGNSSPSYEFEGPANIGSITQGNGINAAMINQIAASRAGVDIASEGMFEDMEQMIDLGDLRYLQMINAGDDIEDVCNKGGECDLTDIDVDIDAPL